jgi:hypothetical protein
MTEPLPLSSNWQARVLRPDGRICGAGVLLTGRHILTCAHVVAEALGCDASGARPAGPVLVDFPASPDREHHRALVAEDGWSRQCADESGDLAVLVMTDGGVRGIVPPRLARCGTPARRNVRAFGYPPAFSSGLWAVARLIGAGGESAEWMQLDRQPHGSPIVPGYSGAGVVDEDTEAVIGCVVACASSPTGSGQPGTSWMIPLEIVAQYWAPLNDYLEDSAAPTADQDRQQEAVADESQLTMRLMAIAHIRDRRTRELYLDRLRRRLLQPLSLHSHGDDIEDVRGLARACLSVPGLMEELLTVLNQGPDSGTPELTDLSQVAASLVPVPLLLRDERNDLYSQLGSVRLAGLEVLYREAVGALGRPLRTRPGDLLAIVQQLEDASYGPRGLPPLLPFLQDVAGLLPEQSGHALLEWLRRVAFRLDIAEGWFTELGHPGSVLTKQRDERHYVITDLTEDWLEPNRYRITIWFQAAGHEQVIGGGDDELIALAEVPIQLDAAIASLSSDMVGSRLSRTFEFILPRNLLDYPVDQWRFETSQMSYRFAMTAPVIVRSQDRMRNHRMQRYWHAKWRWLRDNGRLAGSEAVHWMDNRSPMRTEQVLALLVGDDPPVCVVFQHPPVASGDPDGDVVMAALLGGIPVMIWCREPGAAGEALEEIERLLENGGLAELPERVRTLRRDAVGDQNRPHHPGHSLTLLWDAADRIPQAYQAAQ